MKLFGRGQAAADRGTPVAPWPSPVESIRVLLIDDDEDEYRIMRDVVRDITGTTIELEWVSSFGEGQARIADGNHDVYLIDRRLGGQDGIDLVRAARTAGSEAPLIMLTGERSREVDLAAMEAGATDYLIKGKSDAQLMERTIRYAVTHAQAMAALRRSYRQVAGIEEVGRILARTGPTPETLERVVQVLAVEFGFPHVALYLMDRGRLRLAAYHGYEDPLTELDPASGRVARIIGGRAMVVPNLTLDPEARREDSPMELVAPLMARGGCQGLLNIAGHERTSIGDADFKSVLAIADRLSVALELNRAIDA